MAKEKKISTTVVRVKRDTLKKIEQMKFDGEKSAEYLERIVDTFEKMVDSPNYYIVDDSESLSYKVFTDIADARGAAIVDAVKYKSTPKYPKIAVVVGVDDGE